MVRRKHTEEFRTFSHNAIRINAISALFGSFIVNIDLILDNLYLFKDKSEREQFLRSWKLFENFVTIDEYMQIIREIIVTREIDGFLTYLSRVLLRIFSERPQAFKSFFDEIGRRGETDKKIGMRDILDYLIQYTDTAEVIKQLAQDQVDALAYKGLDTIIDELNNRLKLDFNKNMPEYKSSCELVEIRNIIIHNGCYVSKVFLKRTQRTDLNVGDKFPLSDKILTEELAKFLKFVDALDSQLISHFKLATNDVASGEDS